MLSYERRVEYDKSYIVICSAKFEDILTMTHGKEWQRAYSSDTDKMMDSIAIAKEGGANEEEFDYLKDNISFSETSLK